MLLRLIRYILEFAFWAFTAAVALFVVGMLVGVGLGPAFAYFGPLGLVLMLPLAAKIVHVVRRRRGRVVMSYLEQAVRLNLPLPRMLWAAQRSERGKTGYRLARLRQLLEDGYPVSEALEVAVPEVTPREVSLAAAGEQLGRLAPALARATSHYRRPDAATDPTTGMFYRVYPAVLVLFVGGVLGMLAIFVMPKYQQIFRDFGLTLPPITVTTMQWSAALALPVAGLMAIVLLVLCGKFLWDTFRPFNLDLGAGVLDHVVWVTPVAHGIARDRGLADVCGLLADATEAGTPAELALAEAARLRVNRVLGGRVLDWSERVEDGTPLAEAAREAGLPSLLVGMLATATRAGGTRASDSEKSHGIDDPGRPSGVALRPAAAAAAAPEVANVFRFLSRYYDARFSRSLYVFQGMLIPTIVLAMGAVVLGVVLAMLLPLIMMAEHLMDQTWVM